MVKANLKPEILIRESDSTFYHLRYHRIKIDERNPKYPQDVYWVRAIRDVDYIQYFGAKVPEIRKSQFLKAMNVDDCQVIHDPTLSPFREKREARQQMLNLQQRQRLLVGSEAEFREGKRSATVADIRKEIDKAKK